MLARGALCRLAVSKTLARDLPQLARTLQRTLLSRNASTLPALRALSRAYTKALDARRSYATTTTATKPTATVKRAVKAKAAEKAPPKKKATTTSAAKTTKTTKTTKTAKKPKAASKVKPKAKKTAKKAAPKKKRVAKVLTPEQEEKAKTKKEKAKLTELRKTALKEPVSPFSITAYIAYVQEQATGKSDGTRATVRSTIANVASKWKSLTAAEHEHYNHLAREKSAARQAEYRAWVQSHTPQDIYAANNARLQLRKKLKGTSKKRYPAHTSKIIDDRQVKRPVLAYVSFTKDRFATGDFNNIKLPDASKLLSEEWKALNAGEKKKYQDIEAAEKERYKREVAATS